MSYQENENEHCKIANCEIAKEAWDILVTCHEGADVVKQSKLQRLTTEFETIRMEEEETFNEFYSKLISIVNCCETLGESIHSFRVIKNFLRSLPERFKTQVIMLEGKRKLKEKTVEEVVGIIQTFEADMLHSESHKPKTKLLEKTIAFSSSQRENRDSGSDNKSTENMNTKGKGMKGQPSGPKCYECHGYGHLAHECANKLKKNTNLKANLTGDDDSNSDTSVQKLEENGNFMAFVTSLCSQTSDLESSDDSDEDEGVDLKDSQVLREKYDQLYQENMKISKINQKLGLKNKEVKEELGKMQNQFNDKKGVLVSVNKERDMLKKEVEALKEKNNVLTDQNSRLEIELANANGIFERFNAGSKALDDMLLTQKPFGDKSGLGYLGESPPKQNGGEVNEIKPKKVISKPSTIPIVCNNVNKVQDVNKTSNEKVIPTCHYCHIKGHIRPHCKKLHMAHASRTHVGFSHCLDKFVPTCHFCGVKGHIRPNCFELHGFPIVPPQYHHVNNNGGRYYRSDNGFNRPSRRVSSHGKKMNVNPKHVLKKIGKTEKVKIRPIWVPRSNLRPYTNLSITTLDDTGPSGEVDLAF
ncbi:hypothetical protein RHGRI_025409 [Rhododendron griersonianum]|uniref:CCHC-type domain-containing protein n=1 Tax=Rhododendron griersonianum TaxID=479676 RepID=A0AAV6IQ68_9ERIC|nr:hypothetical protein RHGRI_025409 [Rhododendron griersonianum]